MENKLIDFAYAKVKDIAYITKKRAGKTFITKTAVTDVNTQNTGCTVIYTTSGRTLYGYRTRPIYSQNGWQGEIYSIGAPILQGNESIVTILSPSTKKVNFLDVRTNKFLYPEFTQYISMVQTGFSDKLPFTVIKQNDVFNILNAEGKLLFDNWWSSITYNPKTKTFVCIDKKCKTASTKKNQKYEILVTITETYSKEELDEKFKTIQI